MMTDTSDFKALYLQEVTLREQAEEARKHAEVEREHAEVEREHAERERERERERNRQTTFEEFIRHCHDLLSRPLRADEPSRSTTGKIHAPTGKHCPVRLLPWADCATIQRQIYNSVCGYLQPVGGAALRLFAPLTELEGLGRRFTLRPISSEQDLESYERFAVEDHVRDIISELCKIPSARDEFQLGGGVWFDNHANALDKIEDEPSSDRLSGSRPSRPDQFCIHRVDGNTSALLSTVEYKPPHKLSVENLRAGLRPMDFYREIVEPDTIPTDEPGKLKYNAAQLAGSAVVQEYHVMIQEGLEYSYMTTGLGYVQLRVPFNDPSTLYYDLSEPNMDVDADAWNFGEPKTAINRVLCLCLMSFRSRFRDQA
jgi:hypothetical protein